MTPDLLYRLNQGEESAFKEVFESYYNLIVGYSIKRFSISRPEAEDIVLESFMALHKAAGTLHDDPIKFVYLIAQNKAITLIESEAKRLRRQRIYAAITNPEDDLITLRHFHQLYQQIETLPPQARSIFKMIFFDKLSFTEIARKLGISIQTVRNQKTIAVNLLKNRIKLM